MSSLVSKLRSPVQYHGLGNMIFSNADDNDEEVQKALHVWKMAMEQVHGGSKDERLVEQ